MLMNSSLSGGTARFSFFRVTGNRFAGIQLVESGNSIPLSIIYVIDSM